MKMGGRGMTASSSSIRRLYSGSRRRHNPPSWPEVAFMLNEIYNSRILELAGNIPRIGRLPDPDATATAHSKLCGSTVTIDLKMDGDTVTDFAHDVKACALGQASSSIMARNIVGAKADELRAVLEPVRDYKARHASTMLTFDAVLDAIGQIEKKRAEAAPDKADLKAAE